MPINLSQVWRDRLLCHQRHWTTERWVGRRLLWYIRLIWWYLCAVWLGYGSILMSHLKDHVQKESKLWASIILIINITILNIIKQYHHHHNLKYYWSISSSLSSELEYFLTYADNYAIGYFQRNGFSKHITMPKDRWVDLPSSSSNHNHHNYH